MLARTEESGYNNYMKFDKTFHYDHRAIEKKWRSTWQDKKIDVTDIHLTREKKPFYNLMMFPYPSAEGLHVGNVYAFTGADILGRFKRMQGYEVFEPVGLDGFGIHSENYALKVSRHPMDHAKITEGNFYNQLHRIGAMYDWTRTVETYDPEYYRWTQWLFVQMFKHGLAYRGKALVNWCPGCKTVLADEQIIPARQARPGVAGGDEKCERCGSIVEKRLLEQWFFRITAYAEKLLHNTYSLKWTEKVLVAQRNWIGKQVGLSIDFPVEGIDKPITIWTKYWETVYGATFLVLSSKHWALDQLHVPESNKKDGTFIGAYAINPVNGARIPIWIAEYVLEGVGTGAVMGVPAHDDRDFAFAKKYEIPITQVVKYKDTEIDNKVSKKEIAYEGEGTLINSQQFNGLDAWGEGKKKIADWIIQKGHGQWQSTYHLRDWLISRQRYWGPPIPMIYCDVCAKAGKSWFTSSLSSSGLTRGSNLKLYPRLREDDSMPGWYPVPEDQLPVILPRIDDYKPGNDGVAPLAKHKEFYETTCPGCGGDAVRETDVSDTFLDSSWYFLRYPSVNPSVIPSDSEGSLAHASSDKPRDSSPAQREKNDKSNVPWDPEVTRQWLPVSVYTGGAEHSVLHLMYSRFVTMALKDWGHLEFEEPFPNFFAHGLIIKDGTKMSKSKGNVVNPDEDIDRYGADALRLYLMFTGPYGQGGDFRDSAMEGTYRWINRVWRMAQKAISGQPSAISHETIRALNKLVKKVGEDIERRSYNTAIAAMMEFTNVVQDQGGSLDGESIKTFLKLLAPFAPYMTEELWQRGVDSGQWTVDSSIHKQSWPQFDTAALVDDTVEIVIQVNGKVRDKISVSKETASDKEKLIQLAMKSTKALKFTEGKTIVRTIVVDGRLVNFVI